MRNYTLDQLLVAYELEQRLYDFAEEIDINGAGDVGEFYTEDAVFHAGPNQICGREAIVQFYRTRNENVAKYQKDGARTGRHTFLNVRAFIKDENTATLKFLNVNYAGEGKPPVQGLKGPSAVADCRMECRREADGAWRFTEFAPFQALMGEDDFLRLMLSLAKK